MHATIRTYTDPHLADLLASNKHEVEELIRGVSGVQSYVLLRTSTGCAAVVVGEDEAATSETTQVAADYLRRKAATAPPPSIESGEVILHIGAGVRA